MAEPTAPQKLKSVLVVGGCGFLGHHIVQALLGNHNTTSHGTKISVVDINTSRNRHDKVSYHTCDITSLSQLRQAISTIKPQVIIHTAAALPNTLPTHEPDDVELFKKVNVDGTANLLQCAKEENSVEVFVYRSSAAILKRKESYMVTEDAASSEVQMSISRFDPYSGTKGIADTMVLLANSRNPSCDGGLRTCCLRLGEIYGAGDTRLVWRILEDLRLDRQRYQIGDGTKHSDFLAVENAAHAHILAMIALLADITNDETPKVDGEGLFIADGNPMSYWAFRQKLWAYVGHDQKAEDAGMVSASMMMAVAFFLEWLFFIFSFGTMQPQVLRTRNLERVCLNRTFDISKAKERLKYSPKVSTDDAMKAAAEWARGYQAELGLVERKKNL